eukprot:4145497-Amphidinium_carterae.1
MAVLRGRQQGLLLLHKHTLGANPEHEAETLHSNGCIIFKMRFTQTRIFTTKHSGQAARCHRCLTWIAFVAHTVVLRIVLACPLWSMIP